MQRLLDRIVWKLARRILLRHKHECRMLLALLEEEYEERALRHDGKGEAAARMATFLRGQAAGVRAALGKVEEVLGK